MKRRRRGQVATEYMLAISVIVIAVVIAGYQLEKPLREGFEVFSTAYEEYFAKPGGPAD